MWPQTIVFSAVMTFHSMLPSPCASLEDAVILKMWMKTMFALNRRQRVFLILILSFEYPTSFL